MLQWIADLKSALASHGTCVLVTVVRARGSTPREDGAKMIVWDKGIAGSIGGGNLEFVAISKARAMMDGNVAPSFALETFALGPSLAQCCGGSVSLHFETLSAQAPSWLDRLAETVERGGPAALVTQSRGGQAEKIVVTPDSRLADGLEPDVESAAKAALDSPGTSCAYRKSAAGGTYLLETFRQTDSQLVLFGAGHVGRALVGVLGDLPFQVVWVDPRPTEYPDRCPDNVTPRPLADPLEAVGRTAAGAFYLVMTHSHQLDLAICENVLRREDFRYLGLIGSSTKRARFRRQLLAGGLSQARIDRLICPIGIDGIAGKKPGEIAIAVAAQLLQYREASPGGLGSAAAE